MMASLAATEIIPSKLLNAVSKDNRFRERKEHKFKIQRRYLLSPWEKNTGLEKEGKSQPSCAFRVLLTGLF